jgi:hypothetical protein
MSREIQQCISSVYNAIELFNACYEFAEIRHWLLNSNLGRNENYLSVISQIDKQKKLITRNLTQLSESVDDLEVLINHSKHLVQLERNKDKQFAKHYEKYHIKLNRAVNENKM